ncbi:hypothetical protein AAVH_35127 [Aphelenchoides avenae]|nr:hypothetical protein AAVH_35127 [Aphelenchus avenae]
MFKLIALAAIVGYVVLAAAPSDEEVRQQFLAEHAKKPEFKYLKKKAIDAQKKRTIQRKKASGPQVSPEVQKYVEGDMLLTQAQAVFENFPSEGKQRRAGPVAKLGDGSIMQRPKCPHDSPICYKFKPGSDPWTQKLMRKEARYWAENTCLTWQEGCTSKPTVLIHTNGSGCYTTPGRGFTRLSVTTRGSEKSYSPIFDDEQMSLSAPG